MAKDRFAPKPLCDVISNLPNKLKQFSEKSNEHKHLQKLLEQILDSNMQAKCTIANYDRGTLILNAQSAAVAMRLNYMKMHLLSEFRKHGLPELGQIKIQATPRTAKSVTTNHHSQDRKPKKQMTKQAKHSLLEVAENAPESLKIKLEKLANLADK